jgi:uncharacterized membrane protein HdeD (DUF308 family)
MSAGSSSPQQTGFRTEPTYISRHFVVHGEELRQASGWLLLLGISLIVLGTLALIVPVVATLSAVVIYGWLLLFAGIAQVVASFAAWRWGGFFIHLLMGLVDIVIGVVFLRHWDVGAAVLTLFLIVAFLVGGIFRLVIALSLRFPNWGWTVLSGLITFAVGVILWVDFPWDTVTIPGLFLGIQMLFYGWSAVMLARAARRYPA